MNSVHKQNLGRHYGQISNTLTFDQAYAAVKGHPEQEYATTGKGATFIARADLVTKGDHEGERVIRFISRGKQMAFARPCCWGHKTNCNATHIDCYTQAL